MSSVALNVTGDVTGASLTAETFIVALLGVLNDPSDMLNDKLAAPS